MKGFRFVTLLYPLLLSHNEMSSGNVRIERLFNLCPVRLIDAYSTSGVEIIKSKLNLSLNSPIHMLELFAGPSTHLLFALTPFFRK